MLRTQGEDFWDDARFLAGDLNDTPIALLDKDWEGDECERHSFIVRVGDIVYVFDDTGALRDDPVAGSVPSYLRKHCAGPTGAISRHLA